MPTDEAGLVEQLVRLGVDDPQAAARSAIAEDIPQVAFSRLERLVRTNLRVGAKPWTSGGPTFSVSETVARSHVQLWSPT